MSELRPSARVAVITRTKDRALTLRRTFESVIAQIYRDFVWVLVNDGGAPEPVADMATAARDAGLAVELIHHARSRGRAAAANAGIAAVDSKYIVWLDDDDSWHPEFLEKTVCFLEANGDRCKGVVCQSEVVQEKILDGRIVETGRTDRFPPPCGEFIPIPLVITRNPFPPVSFVFDRQTGLECGGFDEAIEYTEDWDFNTRFVLHGRIAVLPELLAFYHQRVERDNERYGNTITDQQAGYDLSYMTWMDRAIREGLADGRLDRGLLLAVEGPSRLARLLQAQLEHSDHRIQVLQAHLDEVGHNVRVLQEQNKGAGHELQLMQARIEALLTAQEAQHEALNNWLCESGSRQARLEAGVRDLDRMLGPFHRFFALIYRSTGLRWLRSRFR